MKKIVFLIALINAVLIVMLFGRGFYSDDTYCYVGGARLIFDLPGKKEECSFRIIKPLALIFPGFLEKNLWIRCSIWPIYSKFNLLFFSYFFNF